MSLSEALQNSVENVIQTYISNIAERYNLNRDELNSMWTSGQMKKKPQLETIDMNDISIERLHKSNKAEITALCKSRGLKCTGTKDVLINRLLGKEEGEKKEAKKEVKDLKEVKSEKKVVGKKEPEKKQTVDIVKKLTADIPVIPIRRNAYGNFEHPETRLVFNRKTETVIGKQQDDGSLSELTDDDIESCKRFKFKYDLPNNLDKKENLDNIKIDELDSDIDDVDNNVEDEDEIVEVEEDDEEYEYEE